MKEFVKQFNPTNNVILHNQTEKTSKKQVSKNRNILTNISKINNKMHDKLINRYNEYYNDYEAVRERQRAAEKKHIQRKNPSTSPKIQSQSLTVPIASAASATASASSAPKVKPVTSDVAEAPVAVEASVASDASPPKNEKEAKLDIVSKYERKIEEMEKTIRNYKIETPVLSYFTSIKQIIKATIKVNIKQLISSDKIGNPVLVRLITQNLALIEKRLEKINDIIAKSIEYSGNKRTIEQFLIDIDTLKLAIIENINNPKSFGGKHKRSTFRNKIRKNKTQKRKKYMK